MEREKKFVLREVAGEKLLIPVAKTALTFNGLVLLNETGAFLWKKMQEGKKEDELTDELRKEYEVSEEQAGEDIRTFLHYIMEEGIL